jgi:ligand-binding SRPBCC domain-containing protein
MTVNRQPSTVNRQPSTVNRQPSTKRAQGTKIMAGLYHLESTQFLPITLAEAWDFFSTPDNLPFLTPPYLKMVITGRSNSQTIYPGQIISYRLKPLLGIPVSWVTEITHTAGPAEEQTNDSAKPYQCFFVDEQRFGPYAFWHHAHFFKEADGGVEMRDLVHYKLPLGFLGRLAHSIFIRRQLEGIFEFRRKFLENKYPKPILRKKEPV